MNQTVFDVLGKLEKPPWSSKKFEIGMLSELALFSILYNLTETGPPSSWPTVALLGVIVLAMAAIAIAVVKYQSTVDRVVRGSAVEAAAEAEAIAATMKTDE